MSVDARRINFLDNLVIKKEGVLSMDLYIKSTDCNSLLHFHSFHPKPIKKFITRSQTQRINRIVSDNMVCEHRLRELHTKFLSRGYPESILNQSHETDLNYGTRTTDRIPFVHSNHPFANILHRTIRRHWHLLREADLNIPECTKHQDKLVKADIGKDTLPPRQLHLHHPRCGTFPCLHCNQCGNVQKGNTIYHPHSGKQFKIKDYYTCNIPYMVYLIKCPCGLAYVCETTQPIKDGI
ncbi:unnamed protein product [Ranitomeya imitator]|uniref:Helix-turn-helix domain-containing protein n=1 Tax=Ranitomeya imitator TaxID=111125 RepID=A0ABN9LN98_9NEOB|nr:unnamed protein product [Ranitomeya imitator]